tara:strand:- start:119 stop:520 length:402 start_codon:yes stop_codon:yes gene_type:complete
MKEDEGYIQLIKMLRQEIQDLKKYKSECIRLENLLHGYKKVIEELSNQVVKKVMYVKHLQEYLEKFTEGQQGRRGNAVSDAKIYIMTSKGYLEEIKRIEVHASNNPMDTSLRVVLKPNREEKLILPPGYIRDY